MEPVFALTSNTPYTIIVVAIPFSAERALTMIISQLMN